MQKPINHKGHEGTQRKMKDFLCDLCALGGSKQL
jgi:hypothetical protein